MSEGYDNTNRGAIWKNERKELGTHPDFTGTLNVEGVEYFFDAWKRGPEASPSAPALSFRVKRKDKQPANKSAPTEDNWDDGVSPAGADVTLDDDIPF